MNDIFINLKSFIADLDMFSLVDLYRNEFVQGSDWNPVFPCCLIRPESKDTTVLDASGRSLRTVITFILYIAHRRPPSGEVPGALELADSLFEELDAYNVSGYAIMCDNIKFVETSYGTDIYSIQLTIK